MEEKGREGRKRYSLIQVRHFVDSSFRHPCCFLHTPHTLIIYNLKQLFFIIKRIQPVISTHPLRSTCRHSYPSIVNDSIRLSELVSTQLTRFWRGISQQWYRLYACQPDHKSNSVSHLVSAAIIADLVPSLLFPMPVLSCS